MDSLRIYDSQLFVILIFVVVIAILAIQIAQFYLLVQEPTIPQCQEDELVIGWGDYSQGYYEAYLCRAIDDISTN